MIRNQHDTSVNESTPCISVIMPAYNCELYIKQAIDSILNQNFIHFELLILDDASTDSTWNVIQEYQDPRILSFQNEQNLGYLKSCNKLFGLCRGDYITFQDADDWSKPDRLGLLYKRLNSDAHLMICGSNCIKVNESNQTYTQKYPNSYTKILKALESGRTSLFCGASIMFKRELLDLIGSYDSFFNRIGAEDIDWYIRVVEKFKAENIPEDLYYYRQHSYSISKSNKDPLSHISSDLAYLFHKKRILNPNKAINLNTKIILSLFPVKRSGYLEQIIQTSATQGLLKTCKHYRKDSDLSLARQYLYICIAILTSLIPNKVFIEMSARKRKKRIEYALNKLEKLQSC